MFSRFRILAGLLALATIVLAVPTISKAQFAKCNETMTKTTCYSPWFIGGAILDKTPCLNGSPQGIIYRQATDGLGGPLLNCWTAVGNCICPSQ